MSGALSCCWGRALRCLPSLHTPCDSAAPLLPVRSTETRVCSPRGTNTSRLFTAQTWKQVSFNSSSYKRAWCPREGIPGSRENTQKAPTTQLNLARTTLVEGLQTKWPVKSQTGLGCRVRRCKDASGVRFCPEHWSRALFISRKFVMLCTSESGTFL